MLCSQGVMNFLLPPTHKIPTTLRFSRLSASEIYNPVTVNCRKSD